MLLHYSHITLLGTYLDGDALLAGLKDQVPDVLLLDIAKLVLISRINLTLIL